MTETTETLQAKLSSARRRDQINTAGLALAHRRQGEYRSERDAVIAAVAANKARQLDTDVNSPEAVAAQFDEYEVHLALARARIESARARLREQLAEAERYERLHVPFPDCTCGQTGPVSAEAIRRILTALGAPHSPAAASMAVSAPTEATGGAREAQEGSGG